MNKNTLSTIVGCLALATCTATLAADGVSYQLRVDEATGIYTVSGRYDQNPDFPYNMVVSAQATLVLPAETIATDINENGTFAVSDNIDSAGSWFGADTSKNISAPDLNSDSEHTVFQVLMSPSAARVQYVPGVASDFFSFKLNGSCNNQEVRLLDSSEPYSYEEPNISGLASANSYFTILREQYRVNDSAPVACITATEPSAPITDPRIVKVKADITKIEAKLAAQQAKKQPSSKRIKRLKKQIKRLKSKLSALQA